MERRGPLSRADLVGRSLISGPVGATRPADATWTPPTGARGVERTVRVGRGDEFWTAGAAAVPAWGVETGSGFDVEPVTRVREAPTTGWWRVSGLPAVLVARRL